MTGRGIWRYVAAAMPSSALSRSCHSPHWSSWSAVGRSLHLWASEVAQLLHRAHFDTKGGQRPFAAVCMDGGYAQVDLVRINIAPR